MKKIFALLIVVSFVVMGAGSAFAADPIMKTLDRHAVWTKWYDENGNRISENISMTASTGNSPQTVSAKSIKSDEMGQKVKKFDFVHETKYYDYAKDHRNST
ncbi:MAG: hypothetical protein ACE5E9_14550 [Nitrospinaceae bacterium]